MSWGNKPTDGGHFLLSPEERNTLLASEPRAVPFIRRYMGGGDFLNGLERYCLWLADIEPARLRAMPELMRRVEAMKEFRAARKADGIGVLGIIREVVQFLRGGLVVVEFRTLFSPAPLGVSVEVRAWQHRRLQKPGRLSALRLRR